jgi:predicted MPP superfamily phosphohydrolase
MQNENREPAPAGSTPGSRRGAEQPTSKRTLTRRAFLKRSAGLGLGVLGGGVWMSQAEPNWIEVERVSLPIQNLHPAFENWKIAQISDLHVGGWMTRERLQRVVQTVNDLRPDIVAITGDFVTYAPQGHAEMLVSTLSKLQARRDVFGVLGNHDYWTSAKTVKQILRKSGVGELANSFHTFRKDGGALHVCGVDDAWAGAADASRVLETLPDAAARNGGAAILLAHEPDFADEYARAHRFTAQLSGHSHGGQIRVPLIGPLHLPRYGQKYHTAKYKIGTSEMTLYVNRGVGMVWPYVRLNCRPEITLLTLRPA